MIVCDVKGCDHLAKDFGIRLDGKPLHLCTHCEYRMLDMIRDVVNPPVERDNWDRPWSDAARGYGREVDPQAANTAISSG